MGAPFKFCNDCYASSFCSLYKGKRKVSHNPKHCASKDRLELSLKIGEVPKNRRDNNIYNFNIDDDESEEIFNAIKPYIKDITKFVDSGMNALMLGKACGVGKTYTASVMLNQYIYDTCCTELFDFENPNAMFVEYAKFIDTMRYTRTEETTRIWFDKMKNVDLLVLDDIGTVVQTDFILEQTYILINSRVESGKSTIITSNLSEKQLNSYLGSRIVSRLLANSILINFESTKDKRKSGVKRLV